MEGAMSIMCRDCLSQVLPQWKTGDGEAFCKTCGKETDVFSVGAGKSETIDCGHGYRSMPPWSGEQQMLSLREAA